MDTYTHVATKGEKINILIPEGMIEAIENILKVDQSWISKQEFIRQAIQEKIDRWKKEHPGHP